MAWFQFKFFGKISTNFDLKNMIFDLYKKGFFMGKKFTRMPQISKKSTYKLPDLYDKLHLEVAKNIERLWFFLFSYLVCSQIWLNHHHHPMDEHHHFSYITKSERKALFQNMVSICSHHHSLSNPSNIKIWIFWKHDNMTWWKPLWLWAKLQYGWFDHPSTLRALALIILFVEMINVFKCFSQRKKKASEKYFAIFNFQNGLFRNNLGSLLLCTINDNDIIKKMSSFCEN